MSRSLDYICDNIEKFCSDILDDKLVSFETEFLDPKKRLVLITTKFDINTAKTIKFYNLPIRYIYFERERVLEYEND